MMNTVFKFNRTIEGKHLDSFGHVNNAAYLALYEEARWDFITARGFGLSRIKCEKMGPVILDLSLNFKRELVEGERILVKSVFTGMKNLRVMRMEQTMYNANAKVASELRFTMGFMDLAKRKLVKPTDDWLTACGASFESVTDLLE